MFTGLIENLGKISAIERKDSRATMWVSCGELEGELTIGASIAVNGVCLTVVEKKPQHFRAEISSETLALTTLRSLAIDSTVNLELPLRAANFLGGHMVQGHIDSTGEIRSIENLDGFTKISVSFAASLRPYIVDKGSIAIDGVSLTVNRVTSLSAGQNIFELMVIPHTWEKTIIQNYKVGNLVNLEADIFGKYIAKHLSPYLAASLEGAALQKGVAPI